MTPFVFQKYLASVFVLFFTYSCAQEYEATPVAPTQFVNRLISSSTHEDILQAVQEFIAANPDVQPHEIIVSYDIDNTILFDMNRIFSCFLLLKSIPHDEWSQTDQCIYETFNRYFGLSTDVIDPSFYSTFNALHDMGITLIATTARSARIWEETEELLKKHYIFFAKETDKHIFPPNRGPFKMPKMPDLSLSFSHHNVLYTDGHAKGEVFAFLANKAVGPKFFIHIDDNPEHCQNIHSIFIQNSTSVADIAMTVIHYQHACHTKFKDKQELEEYLREKGF